MTNGSPPGPITVNLFCVAASPALLAPIVSDGRSCGTSSRPGLAAYTDDDEVDEGGGIGAGSPVRDVSPAMTGSNADMSNDHA